ncbi:hypothetical protein SteCoe_14570 [Stentor coeruleus]|uniref:TNFR-Cys domain-containing protein n=1 Tax=Stentor coeruleus TaxID=5963 RepID=A0A1R2C5Y5_9CILI|nr:hypothetical protein SteCoe_14570 [Stentor coeruleus]
MILNILSLSLIISLSLSEKILEYKFSKNFGQVFYDTSGNSRHAVNGESSLTTDYDTKPTDRGAYFAKDIENCIKLPPNDFIIENFYISPKFSIVMWIMVGSSYDYLLFFRYSTADDSHIMKLKVGVNYQQIWVRFKDKTYAEGSFSPSNTFSSGTWQLLVQTFDRTQGKVYINGVSQIEFTSTLDFVEETVDFLSYLGHKDSSTRSVEGFFWYFGIFDNIITTTDFYGNTYIPGNCLVEACPLSCDPAILQDGELHCISINFDSMQNGATDSCPEGCSYGCSGSLCLDCQVSTQSCFNINNKEIQICSNSVLTSKITTCADKYYFFNCECFNCHSDCATCDQADICLECIDENAIINNISGCTCKDGYYKNFKNDGTWECLECGKNCSQCDKTQCLKCKDINAKIIGKECQCIIDYSNSIDNSCLCPKNSYEYLNACFCSDGFYMEKLDTYQCSSCHQSCFTCSSSKNCDSCKDPIMLASSGLCSECPKLMFYEDFQCKNCTSPCLDCISLKQCTSCENKLLIVDNHYNCVADCKEGFYANNTNCNKCPELCAKCSNDQLCDECVENAKILNSVCICKKGYYNENSKCNEDYFYASISVSKINKVILLFSEETENPLSNYSINVNLTPSYPFTFKFYQINSTSFYLSLLFTSDIPKGTKITIDLSSNFIYSKSGKILKEKIYNSELYEYIESINSVEAKNTAKSVTSSAKAVVSIGIGCAIISNPSSIWALLSTFQLISYIPLGGNPLTPKLYNFFSSFGKYNIFPNAGLYIFSPNATTEPYLQARKLGNTSSVFWLNSGQLFTSFFTVLCFLPIFYFFSKCKLLENSPKITKIFANYKYSFFIRFWIQAYLDIGVCAIIQLRSVIFT